ncbi:MAG: hypothetical protein IJE26_00625 [Oscillospiraceae bacterium]|nr:hypothetical protein [Oscillospiraceae bacterium]
MKKRIGLVLALALLALLLGESTAAGDGALWGLELCGRLLVPTLLPLFAASGLLNRLGLGDVLAARLARPFGRLFGVSGAGASAFLLGLCGGYPLGAATAASLYRDGRIDREEAEQLLSFCDNTGPAFAVAAIGRGALQSTGAGLFLYGVQVLSAVLTGLLLRRRERGGTAALPGTALPFPQALAEAVSAAVTAMLGVCGWVIFFSALLFAVNAHGALGSLAGWLGATLGLELHFAKAAVWSLLELSGTVGLLSALPLSPATLALAAFALSWGGLCVHLQSLAVCGELSGSRRLGGKLLHGLLAAALSYIMSTFFFLLMPPG